MMMSHPHEPLASLATFMYSRFLCFSSSRTTFSLSISTLRLSRAAIALSSFVKNFG